MDFSKFIFHQYTDRSNSETNECAQMKKVHSEKQFAKKSIWHSWVTHKEFIIDIILNMESMLLARILDN